ncbi:hypothetical protein ACS0TY_011281 [Phlomoides rotata]
MCSDIVIDCVAVALAVDVVKVDGQKRCSVTLQGSGCNLATCRENCLKKYNGNGVCTGAGGAVGPCVCIYNC